VIQVWNDAAAGFVEGEDLPSVVVDVGIKTVERAGSSDIAGEAVNGRVIVGVTAIRSARAVIGSAWRVGRAPKYLSKRMIFCITMMMRLTFREPL
jgi:hypothetical protein